MSQRILVASDLSDGSSEALRHARAYAISDNAEVAVCHVLPHLFGVSSLYAPRNEASIAKVAELDGRVRDLVQRQIAPLLPTPAEVFVDHGSAYAEIVRRAEAWAADLVIVGSTGSSGPARGHLGSVAEHVVRNAHCPVLVARPCSARGVVVAATDFSDPSMPAVATGSREARRRDARLVLVHAIDFASLAVTLEEAFMNATADPATWDLDQKLRDGVVVKLESALAQSGATGDTRVLSGHAAAAIVRCAEDLGAELVVVGNRGRTGLARLALGSVAERVVRTCGCSVLAVRLVT